MTPHLHALPTIRQIRYEPRQRRITHYELHVEAIQQYDVTDDVKRHREVQPHENYSFLTVDRFERTIKN